MSYPLRKRKAAAELPPPGRDKKTAEETFVAICTEANEQVSTEQRSRQLFQHLHKCVSGHPREAQNLVHLQKFRDCLAEVVEKGLPLDCSIRVRHVDYDGPTCLEDWIKLGSFPHGISEEWMRVLFRLMRDNGGRLDLSRMREFSNCAKLRNLRCPIIAELLMTLGTIEDRRNVLGHFLRCNAFPGEGDMRCDIVVVKMIKVIPTPDIVQVLSWDVDGPLASILDRLYAYGQVEALRSILARPDSFSILSSTPTSHALEMRKATSAWFSRKLEYFRPSLNACDEEIDAWLKRCAVDATRVLHEALVDTEAMVAVLVPNVVSYMQWGHRGDMFLSPEVRPNPRIKQLLPLHALTHSSHLVTSMEAEGFVPDCTVLTPFPSTASPTRRCF